MINLIPTDFKENIDYGRKNQRILQWFQAAIFGIIILLVVAAVGRLTIQTAKNQVIVQKESVTLDIEQTNLNEVGDEYSTFTLGLSNVRKLYQRQIIYTRLIRKLATLLPPGSSLTSISLTDTDRAINLDFNNTQDGLGPVIQTNLTNQGDQIAARTRSALQDGLGIALGGEADVSSNGLLQARFETNVKEKQITYYINIPTGEPGDKKKEVLEMALKNGGEFAYQLVRPTLETIGTYESTPDTVPQFISYTVDPQAKRVDMAFSANTIDEVNTIKEFLLSTPYDAFVEAYVFQDNNYLLKDKCTDKRGTNKVTCKTVCKDGAEECSADQLTCAPTSIQGCRYVIRGYYDELYTKATLTEATNNEKETCEKSGNLVCTHKVTATYSQLFNRVDINSVQSCSVNSTTGLTSCPVSMRAEFSNGSTFYLINGTGSAQ
jgi:Tfp pilus assembly protein PilN